MRRMIRPLLLAIAALAGLLAGAHGALAAPALAGPPVAACTLVGTTRTCNLYATTGALALPGGTVTIWGYSDSPTGAAQLPGPTLEAIEGETLVVLLHNGLAEPTSLSFPSLALRPDRSGAPASGTTTYTINGAQPGTFLYQAGPTANGPRQVAMGLFGALVVRPAAANTAYGSAASAYNDEAVLVYSEVDPNLNASPTAFKMQGFNPQYRLINGKVYPNTDAIASAPGNLLLLRQVNAGLRHRSISLLGLRQTVLANDGAPLAYPYGVVSETLGAGQSLDTLVAIPASAPDSAKYPLYDASLPMVGPSGLNAMSGLLTFVQLGAATSDLVGPSTSSVAITTPSGGSAALSAIVSDASSGGSNVAAAEYFVDAVGANGSGAAMTGGFATPNENVSATVATTTLASGTHTFYVHGKDSAGNWGAVASTTLTIVASDTVGPTTSALKLTPSITKGSVAVAIAASASDASSGNSNIAAAEYSIDSGASQPLAPNTTSQPAATLSGSIPSATVNGLSGGAHTIAVRTRDAAGNWGAFVNATLTIDLVGPTASGLTAAPSPNNGAMPFNSATNGVRVDASFSDAASGNSALSAAEVFVDTTGANGSGILFIAADGVFNAPSEAAYAVVPIAQVKALSTGTHTLRVHAKDALGNWGAFATVPLVVDQAGPAASGLTLNPTQTNANGAVSIAASASDASSGGSNIAGGEFFIDTVGAKGAGVALTPSTTSASVATLSGSIPATTVTGLAVGTHTAYVRARDALGNWGATTSAAFTVNDQLFADSFESQNAAAWTTTTNAANLAFLAAAKMGSAGAYGMRSTISGATPVAGTVAHTLAANQSSYRARFYINPNNLTLVNNTPIDVFVALDGSSAAVFRVQLQKSGTSYQVRATVNRTGGTTSTNWYTISGATAVEVAWSSAGSASFSLSTGGTLRQTLTGLNTNSLKVRSVRLGPQGTLTGASGAIYFDAFVSTRNTPIGP